MWWLVGLLRTRQIERYGDALDADADVAEGGSMMHDFYGGITFLIGLLVGFVMGVMAQCSKKT